jgi:hypothetical protein
LTDTVWVAEARANSRVLYLASALMGEIVAVKAAEGHAELLVVGQHARIAVEQVLCNGWGHSKGRHRQAERCRNHRSKGFHGETSRSPHDQGLTIPKWAVHPIFKYRGKVIHSKIDPVLVIQTANADERFGDGRRPIAL